MNRKIVITATSRPHYLAEVISSLRKVDGIENETLLARIEPVKSREGEIVRELVESIDFMNVESEINENILGLRLNTYSLMQKVFVEQSTDTVLYLEDDIPVSPDTLKLWDWFMDQDLENVGVMSLYNNRINGDPNLVFKTRSMTCWGFFITKDSYRKYAEPVWLDEPRMWDSNMAAKLREFPNTYNLMPMLSRTGNIGEYGTHVNPDVFHRMARNHEMNLDNREFNYQLMEHLITFSK